MRWFIFLSSLSFTFSLNAATIVSGTHTGAADENGYEALTGTSYIITGGTFSGGAGSNGANGLLGIPGNEGQEGALGDTGAEGLMGATGEPGAPGFQGAQGTTGADGQPGENVEEGIGGDGQNGSPGGPGENGTDGFQGGTGGLGGDGQMGGQGGTGGQGGDGGNGTDGGFGNPGGHGLFIQAGSSVIVRNGSFAGGSGGIGGIGGTGGIGGQGGPGGPGGAGGAGGVAGHGGQGGAGGAGGLGGFGGMGGAGGFGPLGNGANGAPGADGSPGADGNPGPQGDPGSAGNLGPAGPDGNRGPAGSYGMNGLDRSIFTADEGWGIYDSGATLLAFEGFSSSHVVDTRPNTYLVTFERAPGETTSFTLFSGNLASIVHRLPPSLDFNQSSSYTFATAITESRSITQSGSGLTILTGASTHTGATTISNGAMRIDGSLSASLVTVQSGGTLGGDGSMGGGLTLSAGSKMAFTLGTISDSLQVTGGTLTAPTSGSVTIQLSAASGFSTGTYDLLDWTGVTTSSLDLSDFLLGTIPTGYACVLKISNNKLQAVVSNIAALTQGGSELQGNLARFATASALNELGVGPHSIAGVNDGIYGNSSSWIGSTVSSHIVLSFGTTPVSISRIAWGRDNTLPITFTDRWSGTYTVQVTTAPNPSATTPDSAWNTVAVLDYAALSSTYGTMARRHFWSIPTVTATGVRLKTASALGIICIDELELYAPASSVADWRATHFGITTANTGNLDDFDGDGIKNLLEFAFGTTPTSSTSGSSLSHSGNTITRGQPKTTTTAALYIRRKDHAAAGITYTPTFSNNLTTWAPSVTAPTVVADDGTYEVLSVPFPVNQSTQFFRVAVE